MNIIEKLYCGKIIPHEHNSGVSSEIENLERVLKEKLNKKCRKLLLAYIDAHDAYKEEIAYQNFKYGFKLAYKFMFEGLK